MPGVGMESCMRPEDAVKQVQYVINTEVEESSESVATRFEPAFRRVEADGGASEVAELATQVCASIRAGDRPTPAVATDYAEDIVDDERLLTDGSGN